MWNLVTAVWARAVGLVSIVLPFARGGTARGVPAAVRWVLHALVLAAVLAGLFYLNEYFRIHELIPQPAWARHIWLPLFFLLLYTAGWLLWIIWRLALAGPGDA